MEVQKETESDRVGSDPELQSIPIHTELDQQVREAVRTPTEAQPETIEPTIENDEITSVARSSPHANGHQPSPTARRRRKNRQRQTKASRKKNRGK